MKKLICFLLVFGFYQESFSQNDESIITFKIIGHIELPPPCGYYSTATRIKVELINKSTFTKNKNEVDLIIPCPESYGDNFLQKGKKYYAEITTNFQTDYRPLVVPYDANARNGLKESDYFVQNIKVE